MKTYTAVVERCSDTGLYVGDPNSVRLQNVSSEIGINETSKYEFRWQSYVESGYGMFIIKFRDDNRTIQ